MTKRKSQASFITFFAGREELAWEIYQELLSFQKLTSPIITFKKLTILHASPKSHLNNMPKCTITIGHSTLLTF